MISRDAFVTLVRQHWMNATDDLERTEAAARLMRQDPDWFWNVMVNSYCTNDGSKNLERKRAKYGEALSWSAIASMTPERRAEIFADLPNPRRRSKLAPALLETFARIRDAGGPRAIATHYESLDSAKARMEFVGSFPQIGEKYRRNIPMDVYDEIVLDQAALDKRLHKLIDLIDGAPPRSPYSAREEYLRAIQRDAGIPTLWRLDRLLYANESTLRQRMV